MNAPGGSAVFVRRAVWLLFSIAFIRVVWLAFTYYFRGAPRFPLESAAIIFVAIALVVVFTRASSGGRSAPVAATRGAGWPIDAAYVAAAFLAYFPALSLGLLSDDYPLLALARVEWMPAASGWFFRPAVIVLWHSLSIVSSSVALLHGANILLHGVNAALLRRLASTSGFESTAAVFAGALFLVFPVFPEAVAWLSGMQDVLLTTFALATLLALRLARGRLLYEVASVVFFAAALCTKETAVCIPLIVLALAGDRWRAVIPLRLVVSVGAVIVGYAIWRAAYGVPGDFLVAPTSYMLKQIAVLSVGSLIDPFRKIDAVRQIMGFVSVAVVALAVLGAVANWSRADARFRAALGQGVWMLAAAAPVYAMFFVGPDLQGSRYLYLPACGWALLLTNLLWAATDGNRALVFARAAVITLLLAVMSTTLESELKLWQAAASMRDRVIAEAAAVDVTGACADASFRGVPDHLNGVYVFRNGFEQATGRVLGDHGNCVFEWRSDTGAFARLR